MTPARRSPRPAAPTARPSLHAGESGLIPRGDVKTNAEIPGQGISVIGRASMGGPLDDLILLTGRWARRPGEIVLSHDRPVSAVPGGTVTVTSASGRPKLKVVGIAVSITSADLAWVVPSQLAALRPRDQPRVVKMLYTFSNAASTEQQVRADLNEIRHALPPGAVINWVPSLDTAEGLAAVQGINTPFAVSFGIIALVLAVLMTASIVAAAVMASYRRIGVLKSIGFTPGQVAATYLVQIGIPALGGAIAGTVLGRHWVLPLVNGGPGSGAAVPLWIYLTAPLGLLALTGLAALIPALRAGRLSAVQAIAAGQAPRIGHGFAAHRLAGKLPLPRPISLGLAAPFNRPARSALTLGTLTLGLTAVVLAVGLDASIAKIDSATTQTQRTVLVGTGIPPHLGALAPSQQHKVIATLRAQPGTLAYLDQANATVSAPGVGSQVPITAYQGNAAGLGWDITSGTWFHGPGEVVVNTARPSTAHLAVGQTIHFNLNGRTVTARITGEVYAPEPPLAVGTLLTSRQTLANADIHLPVTWDIGAIRPAGQQGYEASLERALGPSYDVTIIGLGINHGVGAFALVDTSLMRLLTLMIAALAALGVLNSVLMITRERVHDLGIFKALGMTPGQTLTMVICWIAVPALAAIIVALPAGMAIQDTVIHEIGRDNPGVLLPPGVVHVYTAGGLALLALAGLGIAIAGALAPAGRAAASTATTALHAE